jgi:predicted DNA-binding WGR domain protein
MTDLIAGVRAFEAQGTSGRKFWNVNRHGETVHVHFGRVGTRGSHKDSTFASIWEADAEMEKLIASKLKRGYVETTGNARVEALPDTPERFDVRSAFVDGPSPSQALATKRKPAAPQGPRFVSLDLGDDADPKDEIMKHVDDCYELDNRTGATLYHTLEARFPDSLHGTELVVVKTPLLRSVKNELECFALAASVRKYFHQPVMVEFNRIVGTKEMLVAITDLLEPKKEALNIYTMFKPGTVARWYERIGQEIASFLRFQEVTSVIGKV